MSSAERIPSGSDDPDRKHSTELVTLLFTDMVGSTALKQRLGDRAATTFFEQHHNVVRRTLSLVAGGREIETAGDSFFITFATPSEAVQFSLFLQSRLRAFALKHQIEAFDRIGIHVGEVVIKADQSQTKDFHGIQIDICSRVMSLAKGGQVLMTRAVFDSARQLLKNEDIEGAGELAWLNHGAYLLKGLDEAVEICEVREAGKEAAEPPANTEKAQRQVRAGEEETLGWRPAVGQTVPGSRWSLEKKLGEGGFGEVWLGRHQHTKERRVFKFCFESERVRFLKREMTLFRLLKERIGDHPNIVRLHDVYLDKPPFYVEMDYVEGNDLKDWCEGQGGVDRVPLETRQEIVAQVADALQAAHEAGVIHRDVKPANILVADRRLPIADLKHKPDFDAQSQIGNRKSEICIKLTDFGIGQVVSEEALAGITRAGFTQTILSDSSSSRTGTQMYMAPELIAGKPASTRSDIYSLGVVLYQLLIGDFTRPVTTDWANDISDPLLRDDLQHCFAGNPNDRFVGAGQLAKNLRALPERRVALERQKAELAARERAAYRRGILRTASLAAVLILIFAALSLYALRQSHIAQDQSNKAKASAEGERKQRLQAEWNAYASSMLVAQADWDNSNLGHLRQMLNETDSYPAKGFEWYYWQRLCHLELKTLRGHSNGVTSVACSPDGKRIASASLDGTVKIWDRATSREFAAIKGHNAILRSVAFSPSSERILTGGDDNYGTIWDATNGAELLALRGHTKRVTSVAFSPDGKRVATASEDATVKVWDAFTGDELATIHGHDEQGIWSVAFSPDGRRIATGAAKGEVCVWGWPSGLELLRLESNATQFKSTSSLFVPGTIQIPPNKVIWALAFSSDGNHIAGASQSGFAWVWDSATGKQLLELGGHENGVWSVAFSPDGRRIATGSSDRTAKVWDASTGRELLTSKGHAKVVWSVAFSPDGRQLITGSQDGTGKIWNAEPEREPISLRREGEIVRASAISPDQQRIVVAWTSSDVAGNRVVVLDAGTGKEICELKGHTGLVWGINFSLDGTKVVTAGFNDNTARIWDAALGKELLVLRGHTAGVWCAAFSPDGRRVATTSWDKSAKVWDATTGQELLTLAGHTAAVRPVAFAPDGKTILTGSYDNTAKLWDATSGRELFTLKGHTDLVREVAFSSDGMKLLTGSYDNNAGIWDSRSGVELVALKGHVESVLAVCFFPGGRRISTLSANEVKVWDTASGRELLSFRESTTTATGRSVSFSKDASRIISVGTRIVNYDAATPAQVAAWSAEEAGKR